MNDNTVKREMNKNKDSRRQGTISTNATLLACIVLAYGALQTGSFASGHGTFCAGLCCSLIASCYTIGDDRAGVLPGWSMVYAEEPITGATNGKEVVEVT